MTALPDIPVSAGHISARLEGNEVSIIIKCVDIYAAMLVFDKLKAELAEGGVEIVLNTKGNRS